jgi:alkylhydroperoxidase family enzyme
MEEGTAMDFVRLVDVDDLSPELRAMWDATPRAGLQQFVQVMANAERYHLQFSALYASVRFENHLGHKLTELVRLAVANTTECPVCMAGRLPAAIDEGMSEDLVGQLDDIDHGDFTDAERAALRFAHKFGTDHLSVDDDDKAALRRHFSDEQIVELGILCGLCLGYGRFSAICGLSDAACAVGSAAPGSALSGS